jgi:cobalamin-dependent methionine synthase I
MKKISLFDPITVPLPEKTIYRRLGFKKDVTRTTASQNAEIQKYMDEARSLVRLKGVGLRASVIEKTAGKIRLEEGVSFESRQLAAFLSASDEIILMAATAGKAIMDAIRQDTAGANVTRGVVYDATASEMTDAALDWIVSYYNQTLRREGKAVTKSRYSAGYGDFTLMNQLTIYKLLHLDDLGVAITEHYMLVPEKSVTAVAGIVG